MKPLFGGLYSAMVRFPCLWGLRMVVKNIQNVKSEVKE